MIFHFRCAFKFGFLNCAGVQQTICCPLSYFFLLSLSMNTRNISLITVCYSQCLSWTFCIRHIQSVLQCLSHIVSACHI